MSANRLNSAALPSITGSAAPGPRSPRPSTAEPSVTTATVLRLMVNRRTSSGCSAIARQTRATRGVGHRQVVAGLERHLRLDLELAAEVQQEGAVADLADGDALDVAQRLDDLLGVVGVRGRAGDVDGEAVGPGLDDVDRRHHAAGGAHGVADPADRRGITVGGEPHGDRVRREGDQPARTGGARPSVVSALEGARWLLMAWAILLAADPDRAFRRRVIRPLVGSAAAGGGGGGPGCPPTSARPRGPGDPPALPRRSRAAGRSGVGRDARWRRGPAASPAPGVAAQGMGQADGELREAPPQAAVPRPGRTSRRPRAPRGRGRAARRPAGPTPRPVPAPAGGRPPPGRAPPGSRTAAADRGTARGQGVARAPRGIGPGPWSSAHPPPASKFDAQLHRHPHGGRAG